MKSGPPASAGGLERIFTGEIERLTHPLTRMVLTSLSTCGMSAMKSVPPASAGGLARIFTGKSRAFDPSAYADGTDFTVDVRNEGNEVSTTCVSRWVRANFTGKSRRFDPSA